MQTIMVDMDDVLTYGNFSKILEDYLGYKPDYKNLKGYYIQDLLGDKKNDFFSKFKDMNMYENEKLYSGLNTKSSDFFEKRGYIHSWDCNCFDMFLPLKEFDKTDYSIGSVIDGILYRWATIEDLDNIVKCVDDAEENFTKYYKNEKLYEKTNNQRVLVALRDNEVVGTLIVSVETEAKDLGCVGCTTVKHSCRGKHIGVNIVIVGTNYLKDIGLTNANLSYTYTGMDHMYGYSGYKISCYYMMARKKI